MARKILFVCSGNTCRSPMAEALFSKLAEEDQAINALDFEVLSAGLYTRDGLPASPEAIAAMKWKGIDLSKHKTQQVYPDLLRDADIILVMTESHRQVLLERFPDQLEKVFTIGEFAGYDNEIADPFGRNQDVYMETAQQLENILYKVIDKLKKEQQFTIRDRGDEI